MKVIKRLLYYTYLINKISWLDCFRFYKKNSKNIILIFPSFPKQSFYYFFSGVFENDLALINALNKQKINYRIVVGGKKLYKLRDSKVYHNVSQLYSFYEGNSYADSLLNYLNRLHLNNNVLIPRISDSSYWENKGYMHKKFKELNISHPQTYIVDSNNPAPNHKNLRFPILFKPSHSSGSRGIEKINNSMEYIAKVSDTELNEYLIQEWIDMRRDLRLIYVGNELVVHYWRINKDADWKPTSTGHGSSVDFYNLPNNWMDFIYKEYKKLAILAGAFDITWKNDDLSTPPIILEVSPAFSPNPKPVGKYKDLPYSKFKKNIFGSEAYYKKHVDLVFDLKVKLLRCYEDVK